MDAIRDTLGGHNILMNDLDSNTDGYEELAGPDANGGKGWQPIGTEDHLFTGSLDGQGYEIRDLFINRPGEYQVGIFGWVGGAIKNLGVVNANVIAGGVSGLAGYNYYDTVSNSYSGGTMRGYNFAGGLVGWNHGGTVSNSYSTGGVTGEEYVGGLVGVNWGTVCNSCSTGSVAGEEDVGGLVGSNAGTVSNSYSSANVTCKFNCGCLVGLNTGTVTNSDCRGTVIRSPCVIWTSGQATPDGGTGKTTAEMHDMGTFAAAGWDICAVAPGQTNPNYIWNIVNRVTYPFLS